MKTIVLSSRTVDILQKFTMHPYRTQPELQSLLGISPPTAFRAVDQLRELGILLNGKENSPDGRGRPATQIGLHPHGLCFFALVIRSDETQLYYMNAYREIQDQVRIDVSPRESYETALQKYAKEIQRMIISAGHSFKVTPGVGISFAGWVDAKTGIIHTPSRFKDWHKRDLPKDLESLTGLQCFIDNDAISLTKAAFWFATKKMPHSFALVYLDFGLGTGYCLQNKIYTGRSHISAGLSHTRWFDWSQDLCHCGQIGCLETVLTVPSLLKRAVSHHIQLDGMPADTDIDVLEPVNVSQLFLELENKAQAGDQNIIDLLSDAGMKAGIVGATLVKILDLPMIVFAGELTELSETLWKAVKKELEFQFACLESPAHFYRLRDVLDHDVPEALGASAAALGGLYKSKTITLLCE